MVMTPGEPGGELAHKIARLVEEKGWNQEVFARISNLNRHTVRQILNAGPRRRLRNATVSQCAEAFGFTVSELRNVPLDRLMLKLHGKAPADEATLKFLCDNVTLPELAAWLERNPRRAAELTPDEATELLDLQAPGGAMAKLGAQHFVELIERRRRLLCQVRAVAGTEYLGLLEQVVGLVYEKVAAKEAGEGR